jgi:hypothetical protein
MDIIYTTLLTSVGVFLVAGIIIELIERFFSMKERFTNED